MARKSEIGLLFPSRGVCRGAAYSNPKSGTSPDALNVWLVDADERRSRGGSRPGLASAFTTLAGTLVQWLGEVVLNLSGSNTTRLCSVADGKFYLDDGAGAFTQVGTGLHATDPLQVAFWGQSAYITDTTSSSTPQTSDLTVGSPSLSDWVTDYYTLEVFSSGGVNYPIYRQDEITTFYYDSDNNGYPGWPHTTGGVPYTGTLYDSSGDEVTQATAANEKLREFALYADDGTVSVDTAIVGMAIDSSGNILIPNVEDSRVDVYSNDGTLSSSFGSSGTGNGQFDTPTDVAIDSSGNVWVVDSGNDRIQKFTSAYVYSAQVGSNGTGNGQFDAPKGIVVDSSDNVFVTDSNNDRVQKFNSSAVYQSQFGSNGTGNGQFDTPESIAIDGSDNLYVADTANDRYQKFNSSGTYQSEQTYGMTLSSARPHGIGMMGDNFATGYMTNSNYAFTVSNVFPASGTGGTLLINSSYGTADKPVAIAEDSSGTLYVYLSDTASGNTIDVYGSPNNYVVYTDTGDILDYTSGSSLNYESSGNLVGIYKGTVPTECPLICRWQDRIVLAGEPAHIWYMSRAGDPKDFDYGRPSTDVSRAQAGQSTSAGAVGEPITALIPFADNYLILAGLTSLWIMRGGAPGAGGRIEQLSATVGCVGPNAWCHGPNGEVFILSQNGAYVLAPAVNGEPQPISHVCLPDELRDLSEADYYINLGYDHEWGNVHFYMTSRTGGTDYAYTLDISTLSWWPETYHANHAPTAVGRLGNKLHIGSSDGNVYTYSDSAEDDDGTNFSSYVIYGPYDTGRSGFDDGMVYKLVSSLDKDSGNVTMGLYTDDDADDCVAAAIAATSPFYTATLTGGTSITHRPRMSGKYFCIRIDGTAGSAFELENLRVAMRSFGRQRIS